MILVAHTGFEPVISSLRGRCPRPLDECAIKLAGEEGFEPSLTDSESAVLPLDDSPARLNYSIQPKLRQW